MKDFHKQMSNKLGALKNVDKTIQELEELQEKLRDWKTLYYQGAVDSPDFRDCMDDIQEERVDCGVMLERLDEVFNFSVSENKFIETSKINRTSELYL